MVLFADSEFASADGPPVQWEKTFGGTIAYDYGNSVQQTSDGGYIIAGRTNFSSAGGYDVYLVKTDPNGDSVWQKTFGGSDEDVGYSVQQTYDGGYIIAGTTHSFGAGSEDVYLIKSDPNGDSIWRKTFGGDANDYGYSVQQTTDGGYVIAGVTDSFGAGSSDVYLIKTDSAGNLLWQKTFGGDLYDEGRSVQQTTDGGFIITGYTESFGTEGCDVYLVKTDPNGNQKWEKTFGLGDEDRGYSVRQTSDGGYIIAGMTYSVSFDPFVVTYDAYLIKTDANGNSQWQKTFGAGDWDWYVEGRSVQQTSDGGYIIAVTAYMIFFGVGSPSRVEYEIFLVKTDPNGNSQWEKNFGVSWQDFVNSVQQTSDGGYIIAGTTSPFGTYDVYLVKADPNGDSQWEKTLGTGDDDRGYSIQQTSDGGYIIAGKTWSFGAGSSDVYLIKTDSAGNLLWQKAFGGSDYDEGRSVQQTSDGGYIVAGWTTSFGAGNPDVYLIKTGPNGNSAWQKTFGGDSNDYGYSAQQTTDGGYIIAGVTDSYGAGSGDVYLIKTDSAGNLLWQKTFGGSDYDEGSSVQQTSDGGYIIAGNTSSFGPADMVVKTNVYLVKTDSNGNSRWEKTFGFATDREYGFSVQQTSDGGYIIAGYRHYFPSENDGYLIKTDPNGNSQWEKTLGGEGYSVQQTLDGGYIIAGTMWWRFGDEYFPPTVYAIKTDPNGNSQWEKIFGIAYYGRYAVGVGYSVQQTSDGGYIIAGEGLFVGAGHWDIYLIKLCNEDTLAGDLNCDASVNFEDFAILADQWLQPPGIPSADIAPSPVDGIVNYLDLAVLVENWLESPAL